MKKIIIFSSLLVILNVKIAYSQNITTIDNIMYQNQPFSKQDKINFDKQQNGGRVWDLNGARKYCKELTLNNYKDWRLPNLNELKKLLTKTKHKNSKNYNYYIKKKFIENMPPLNGKHKSAPFLSDNSPAPATLIYFDSNTIVPTYGLTKQFILCIRKPEFTIIDGLMYQNQPFSKKDDINFNKSREGNRVKNIYGAKKYCQNLTIGGYSNWRLPTMDELEKLTSKKAYTNSKGISYNIKKDFIENMPKNNFFWTSTKLYDNYYIIFELGNSKYTNMGLDSMYNNVLCVRKK